MAVGVDEEEGEVSELLDDLIADVAPALVVVPNALSDRINEVLDEALADAPQEAIDDRDTFYRQLLAFASKYGYVPNAADMKLEKSK